VLEASECPRCIPAETRALPALLTPLPAGSRTTRPISPDQVEPIDPHPVRCRLLYHRSTAPATADTFLSKPKIMREHHRIAVPPANSRSTDHSQYSPPLDIRISAPAAVAAPLRKRDRVKSFLLSWRGRKEPGAAEAKRDQQRRRIVQRVAATTPRPSTLHPLERQDQLAAYRAVLTRTSTAAVNLQSTTPEDGVTAIEQWLANTGGTSQYSDTSAAELARLRNETPTRRGHRQPGAATLNGSPVENREMAALDARIAAVNQRLHEDHPDLFVMADNAAPPPTPAAAGAISSGEPHDDRDVVASSLGYAEDICCAFCGEIAFVGKDYPVCQDCLENLVEEVYGTVPGIIEER
jgi:hypothetical protein